MNEIYGFMRNRFLPGVPSEQIEQIYNNAPGNEIRSGKFDSPESSAALVANTFGFFLNTPGRLPALPGCDTSGWPASSVALEKEVRFPWRARWGHPVLDVLMITASALIGIESKRFEPFRDNPEGGFTDTYWRDVWGDGLNGYQGSGTHSAKTRVSTSISRRTSWSNTPWRYGLEPGLARNIPVCLLCFSTCTPNLTYCPIQTGVLAMLRRLFTGRRSATSRRASKETR